MQVRLCGHLYMHLSVGWLRHESGYASDSLRVLSLGLYGQVWVSRVWIPWNRDVRVLGSGDEVGCACEGLKVLDRRLDLQVRVAGFSRQCAHHVGHASKRVLEI
jgi:hypothetical protein